MAPGFWKKLKNFASKVGNAIKKGAAFVRDKIIPGAGKVIKTVAEAAPGVIGAIAGAAGPGKISDFANGAGRVISQVQQGYNQYAPAASQIAGALAGNG